MQNLLAGKKARDVMRKSVLPMDSGCTVTEAVGIMEQRGFGACVVVDAIQNAVGIFTERDLMCRIVARGVNPATTKITDVMTPNIVSAQIEDDAWELLITMVAANFRHLPVMDGRTLVGLVSMKEFCRHLVREVALNR